MFNKKFLLLALLMSILVFSSKAFALSDKEYKQFMQTPAFAQADKALNEAWKNARASLDGDDFEALKKTQVTWIKSGRDNEAKPLLKKMKRVNAYATVTNARAKYINDYVQNLTHGNDDDDLDAPDDDYDNNYNQDSDLPDDLPNDLPDDVTLNTESPKKSQESKSKPDSKNNFSGFSSQESAAEFLEERLAALDKIAMNESLEFLSQTEINGENCWLFSAQFNFNETGRYAVSPSGKIYELDGENFSPLK